MVTFILQNLKKRELRGHVTFGAQNDPIPLNENFFGKTINTIFMYLLAPAIAQNLQNILRANPELRGRAIFGPKNGPFAPNKNFPEKSLIKLSYELRSAIYKYLFLAPLSVAAYMILLYHARNDLFTM